MCICLIFNIFAKCELVFVLIYTTLNSKMMKNILFIFVAILTIGVLNTSAQTADEKELRKEWAKKVKAMDPLEIKKLMDHNTELETEKTNLNSKISNLESKIKIKEELNRSLLTELDSLKSAKPTAVATTETPVVKTTPVTKAVSTTSTPSSDGKQYKADKINYNGVVFKVQVGAFKNKDLSKYLDNNKNFSGDVDSDGQRKYTLGLFTDYWEADNFKKLLREMGVTDAWVVAYKAGQRVSIKDVLEGSVAE